MQTLTAVLLTVMIGIASAIAVLDLASPSARSAIHIYADFVYSGIEDGPYFWNMKCMDPTFAEMVGSVCTELNVPAGLDIALFMALNSETMIGRLSNLLSHCGGRALARLVPFLTEALVFTSTISLIIFVTSMGLLYLNSLHSQAVVNIEAIGRRCAVVLGHNDILKNRLASANTRLAELHFKRNGPCSTVQLGNDELLEKKVHGIDFDAIRDSLRSSKKRIAALKARNIDLNLEARLMSQLSTGHKSKSTVRPQHADIKAHVLPNSPTVKPTKTSGDLPMTPDRPASARSMTRIPLLSASAANKLNSPSSMGLARSPANKSPFRSLNRPRSVQPMHSPAKLASQSVRSTTLLQRRSVFAVGMRTPDCVYKGKVRAKVSRNTAPAFDDNVNVSWPNADGKENDYQALTGGIGKREMVLDDVE